jgi:hypothetical protein
MQILFFRIIKNILVWIKIQGNKITNKQSFNNSK